MAPNLGPVELHYPARPVTQAEPGGIHLHLITDETNRPVRQFHAAARESAVRRQNFSSNSANPRRVAQRLLATRSRASLSRVQCSSYRHLVLSVMMSSAVASPVATSREMPVVSSNAPRPIAAYNPTFGEGSILRRRRRHGCRSQRSNPWWRVDSSFPNVVDIWRLSRRTAPFQAVGARWNCPHRR